MDQTKTKTLAEIYIQQGHLQEAYEIFKVLSEKDPSNKEIQKRLKELDEKLNLSSPWIPPTARSTDEKIRILKGWLANIRERRRK
ncbi:MAG: tetratricopeptide repeat protein [Thermodesulfobacteriota bacterium]